jgi:hypothetical protein
MRKFALHRQRSPVHQARYGQLALHRQLSPVHQARYGQLALPRQRSPIHQARYGQLALHRQRSPVHQARYGQLALTKPAWQQNWLYLTFQILAITLHTTRYNIKKIYLVLTLLLCVLYDPTANSDFCLQQP